MSQKKREELEALAVNIEKKPLSDVLTDIEGAGLLYLCTFPVWAGRKGERYWSGSFEDYWGINLYPEGDNELIRKVEVFGCFPQDM